ncbi:hypothetical protein MTR_7g083035 [Medicago truncatula]|uniref:Uncharacterized protein n=1 Tax=Medicago truncatula TaxID=3880 RepID=A0A072UC96_MEDTR|nr:hypothetical protein MTR_7g083035 [Medicago truncatula]
MTSKDQKKEASESRSVHFAHEEKICSLKRPQSSLKRTSSRELQKGSLHVRLQFARAKFINLQKIRTTWQLLNGQWKILWMFA